MMSCFPKYLLKQIDKNLQHIDIVFWKGTNIKDMYIDHVRSFVIEKKYDIENEKSYTYRGVSTNVTEECQKDCTLILEQIQTKVNLEDPMYKDFFTFSLIINDTVYFFDMLQNLENYTASSYEQIGKMYLMREMLDVYLMSKKLKYLEQDHTWIHKDNLQTKQFE